MTGPSSPSHMINARAHAILRFNHAEEFAQIKRELWRMYDQGYRFDRSDRATAAPGFPRPVSSSDGRRNPQHGTQQAPADHPQASTGPDARNVGAR